MQLNKDFRISDLKTNKDPSFVTNISFIKPSEKKNKPKTKITEGQIEGK